MGGLLKRAVKFIIKGVPQVNIQNKIVQVNIDKSFDGKSIIVTGGSRGIGYSIAEKLLSGGAEIVITGRNEKTLKSATSSLGGRCHYVVSDAGDIQSCLTLIKESEKLFSNGRVDGLVNNAGISLHEGNFRNVSVENFDKQFDVNLKGPYFLIQSAIKYFEDNNIPGNIIVITSERGVFCDDLPYGLSKSAISSYVGGVAKRSAIEGIRINAIAPGLTGTDLIESQDYKNGNSFAMSQTGGRIFAPEEMAEVVAFLMSDSSKCINGQVLVCNCGNSINSVANTQQINTNYFKNQI